MTKTTTSIVSDYGDRLVVRIIEGVKTLVDPRNKNVAIYVHSGRRASLIDFRFCDAAPSGRDTLTVVFKSNAGLGFASVGFPKFQVFLRDLPEGQIVDILPSANAAAAFVPLPRPVPVLCGAVEIQLVAATAA